MDYELELKKIGKGWFVLKLAEEKGIDVKTNTYYGTKNSMETREKVYEKTRKYHKEMLDFILKNWNNRITAGSPKVSNSDLLKFAKLL